MYKEPSYIEVSTKTGIFKNLSSTAVKLSFLIARDMDKHEADMYKRYKLKLCEELEIKLCTINKCIKELVIADILIRTESKGFYKVNNKVFFNF